MPFQTTDKILVNRGGVDYQADIAPLVGPEIKEWIPPTEDTIELLEIPSLEGTGVSPTRPGYPLEHQIAGCSTPQHVRMPDESHNYIVVANGGGSYGWQAPAYFLMLDNELNITKRIETPVPDQYSSQYEDATYKAKATDCSLLSFNNSGRGLNAEAGEFANMLVWSHFDGIWCSMDYGDTWTKFEDKNGPVQNRNCENTQISYSLNHARVDRTVLTFNRVDDPTGQNFWCFDNIKYEHFEHNTRDPIGMGVMFEADPQRRGDIDDYYLHEFDADTGLLALYSEHHTWDMFQVWRLTGEYPWSAFSVGNEGGWLIAGEPDNEWSPVTDSWDDFPQMTIIRHAARTFEVFKENVFKKFFEDIPDRYVGGRRDDDAAYRPDQWCIAWDSAEKAFLCHYDQDPYFYTDSNGVQHQPGFTLVATRNFQQGWYKTNAYKRYEIVQSFNETTRSTSPEEVDAEARNSSMSKGTHDAFLHRIPGSSTAFFMYQIRGQTSVILELDSPVNGEVATWGWELGDVDLYPFVDGKEWIMQLEDGRLWHGVYVSKEPFYSLKPGLLVDGHFIEQPQIEVGSPLQSTFNQGDDSHLTNLPIADAYTKAESDAKFLAKNIASLPYLS